MKNICPRPCTPWRLPGHSCVFWRQGNGVCGEELDRGLLGKVHSKLRTKEPSNEWRLLSPSNNFIILPKSSPNGIKINCKKEN